MTIEHSNTIDFAAVDKVSGDLWLTISDHLPWDKDESEHLILLQSKLNGYLRFIESGEVFTKLPDTKGRRIVINLVGKFPLNKTAETFVENVRLAIEAAGLRLQFSLLRPN